MFFLRQLPDRLVSHGRLKGLNVYEISLLRILGDLTPEDQQYFYPSQATLAMKIPASPRTVSRAMQKLKQLGMIFVEVLPHYSGFGHSRVRYHLHFWRPEDLVNKEGAPLPGTLPWMFERVHTAPCGSKGQAQGSTRRLDAPEGETVGSDAQAGEAEGSRQSGEGFTSEWRGIDAGEARGSRQSGEGFTSEWRTNKVLNKELNKEVNKTTNKGVNKEPNQEPDLAKTGETLNSPDGEETGETLDSPHGEETGEILDSPDGEEQITPEEAAVRATLLRWCPWIRQGGEPEPRILAENAAVAALVAVRDVHRQEERLRGKAIAERDTRWHQGAALALYPIVVEYGAHDVLACIHWATTKSTMAEGFRAEKNLIAAFIEDWIKIWRTYQKYQRAISAGRAARAGAGQGEE